MIYYYFIFFLNSDLSNNKIKNLPEGFKLSHVDR